MHILILLILGCGLGVKSNVILDSLNNVISSSYLLHHDFLRCFSDGDFKNMEEAASIFASNHFKYSENFANYLQTVADKIDDQYDNDNNDTIKKQEIVEPILKEMDEELGIYNAEEMNKLTKIGIDSKWYNKIPHKYLSKRFFDSLNIENNEEAVNINKNNNVQVIVQKEVRTRTGDLFTEFMTKLYHESNVCQSLAIMGYTEIGETIQTIYHQIWNGLKYHTKLTDDQIVIFPLHSVIDDQQSVLIKSSFEKYMKHNPDSCKYEDIQQILKTVLERRIKMYDDIRAQIENKQNYHCKQPYYSQPEKTEDEYQSFLKRIDWNYQNNLVDDIEEDVITSKNKMVITDLIETEYNEYNEYNENIEFIDRRYIAIFIHIIVYLYVILRND